MDRIPAMRLVLGLVAFLLSAAAAFGQEARHDSSCLALAGEFPGLVQAAFTPVRAQQGAVTITYAGHSTYVIETPAGVRIATDFSGRYGAIPLPRIVTMNKAHSTHYT